MSEHLPEAVARERRVLAIAFEDGTLTLARPETGFADYDRDCVEFILSSSVNWKLFPKEEIAQALVYAYGNVGEIAGCSWKFRFECPKKWGELHETSDNRVRHCASCSKLVFLCSTDEEIALHSEAQDCVCIVSEFGESMGDVIAQEFSDEPIDFSDDIESENAG